MCYDCIGEGTGTMNRSTDNSMRSFFFTSYSKSAIPVTVIRSLPIPTIIQVIGNSCTEKYTNESRNPVFDSCGMVV